MSQATEPFNADIAPIANVAIGGQIGPNIVGSGIASFNNNGGGTFYLYFSPSGAAQAAYGVNGSFPSTPLSAGVWTPINGASSVNVRYAASTGADLKLAWAQ